MSSSFYDTLLSTAKAYTKAHNERDHAAVTALSSANCIHHGGPATVSQPRRTNEEYQAFNTEVYKLFASYNSEMTDYVIDERKRKVVVYLHATGKVDNVGEYENEYVVTLTMTEDGKQVEDQDDFIDSWRMMEWVKKVGDFEEEFKDKTGNPKEE